MIKGYRYNNKFYKVVSLILVGIGVLAALFSLGEYFFLGDYIGILLYVIVLTYCFRRSRNKDYQFEIHKQHIVLKNQAIDFEDIKSIDLILGESKFSEFQGSNKLIVRTVGSLLKTNFTSWDVDFEGLYNDLTVFLPAHIQIVKKLG